MLILPSYLFAAITGINSGRIISKFGNFKTLLLSLILGIFSLLFTSLMMDVNIIFLGLGACLLSSSFALLYAPFMQLLISTLNKNKIRLGIFF